MVTAVVREWRDEEGWGVLDCPETPGGCWGHYSDIQMAGFRTLAAGQRVELRWEAPGFRQDGYAFRSTSITPLPPAAPTAPLAPAAPAASPRRRKKR
ncbi:S1 domain-containing protein [Streptomyces yaizuensis]|uniref:Cold shock domain-containing protein n=1 Tax=Streptomyces yaizuensis TaxID=2989713 RepID=A0ABQ5P031_9ACTN|nr:cold shock domain-containing protein [Streptomyces sp. YSPA8]GLF95889.1 cold shock domain-containing protein [Streptomyces sp. YSPA8]